MTEAIDKRQSALGFCNLLFRHTVNECKLLLMSLFRSLPMLFAFLVLGGCASQSLSSHGDWFDERQARMPIGSKIYVCHAFMCSLTTPVTLNAAELAEISAPLKMPAENAAAERLALSSSVQIFERIIGNRVGTANDRGGLDIGGGDPSQMDCIDEATNTTSLMLILAARGDLRFHQVARPVSRGFFLDGRYPHATAVLREKGTDLSWAIDSWQTANSTLR